MEQRYAFDHEEEFLARLRQLLHAGTPKEAIELHMPYPPHGVEELMAERQSTVRFFALGGATGGFLSGLGFTTFTVLWWPLITGGKPIISLPPFLLIGYILTILFGTACTFAGFLLLARLPSVRQMAGEEEFGNQFVIVVHQGDAP